MTDLEKLRAEIEPGWTVKIVDHDYLDDSRDAAMVEAGPDGGLLLRPEKPWSSQGRKFSTRAFGWDGEKEVDGRRARLFHTPSPRTGKARRLIKTFVFAPPTGG